MYVNHPQSSPFHLYDYRTAAVPGNEFCVHALTQMNGAQKFVSSVRV